MRVVQFPHPTRDFVYYSEGPTPEELASAGWLTRQFLGMQVRVDHREEGIGPKLQRLMARLHRLAPADEPMLRSFWCAAHLQLHHPSTLTDHDAIRRWRHYLGRRWWAQGVGVLVNGILTPITALLMFIPGPNVIGYWFAFRFVCRLLALLGISRALKPSFPIDAVASDDLNPTPVIDDDQIARWGALFGLDVSALKANLAR